jgi:hypothetical protein
VLLDHFFYIDFFVNTHFHNIFISEKGRAHKREIGDEVLSLSGCQYTTQWCHRLERSSDQKQNLLVVQRLDGLENFLDRLWWGILRTLTKLTINKSQRIASLRYLRRYKPSGREKTLPYRKHSIQ